MSNYARAATRVQWFADRYPGARMDPNVVVLHTTEGTDWPSYSGGATAPNTTAKPIMAKKRLAWRAHFPDEMSARALQNDAGGVETNTLNAVQVELVGTCDPAHRDRWGSLRAGVDYIYWPNAPQWALDDLADYLADMHKRHGIKLQAPDFLPYPASYGNSRVRFTFAQWRGFYGVCGHQHVPENDHGDPGDLPIGKVLDKARDLAANDKPNDTSAPPTPTEPKPLPVPDCEDRAVLRVGTANLEHGRNRAAVRRELAELLPLADVWIINEADDYADILGTLPGWTWHAGTKPGQDKTGILERTKLGGTFALHRGSEQGWFTSTGQRTAPKWIPELRIGGVRVYGIHFPPSIERGGRHLPTLPVRRWAVYKEQMTALAALLRPRGPVIVGGDWNVNALADKGGRWFPRSQMAHLGLQRDKNVRGTHGKRVIDSLWSRDVVLTETKLGPKTGSDHRAVVCTYEVRKP